MKILVLIPFLWEVLNKILRHHRETTLSYTFSNQSYRLFKEWKFNRRA